MPMKVKKLKVTERDQGGYWARVEDLAQNELNYRTYKDETAEQKHISSIARSMSKRWKNKQSPNFVPIPVFEDGLMEGGHSRVNAAIEAGLTWVWVVFTDTEYPDKKNSYDNAKALINHNLNQRQRGYATAYGEYLTLKETYVEQFGCVWPKEVEKENIDDINSSTKFLFGKNTIDKLKQIKKDPQVWKELDNEKINLTQAYNLVKDKGPEYIADPDRHVFHDDFRKYPFIVRYITKRPFDLMRGVLESTDRIMFDPVAGWERQFIGGMLSNFIMSAVVEAFNKTGVKKLRATSAGSKESERKKKYEDVGFPVLDELSDRRLNDPEKIFFPTNIEIKVSRWKRNCSETIFEANWAISRKPAQEFIMCSYTAELNKYVMMLVTIDGKDWTKSGTTARITLTKLHQLNPTYLIGELFEGEDKKVLVQWGDA